MKIFVILQPVNGYADLAQLAERKLPKLQVAGSSPVIRSHSAGSLAQLVQSACLTSRRSLVRTQQFPQKRPVITTGLFLLSLLFTLHSLISQSFLQPSFHFRSYLL